jgi:hypothetical protein
LRTGIMGFAAGNMTFKSEIQTLVL